jgi:thioesterase domain-containing protein
MCYSWFSFDEAITFKLCFSIHSQTLLSKSNLWIFYLRKVSWLFPSFGWGNLFKGKVHLAKIKCDHLELMEEPFCEEIGQIIQTIED